MSSNFEQEKLNSPISIYEKLSLTTEI